MIIVRIFGGLGNQLFQYAAGRAVALNAGLPLKLDILGFATDPRRKYRLNLFHILENPATQEEVAAYLPPKQPTVKWVMSQFQRRLLPLHLRPLIIERSLDFKPDLFRVKHSAYLFGYWQSEQYFKGIADLIRQEFTLRPQPSEQNCKILEKMANVQAVSLHVRRGDYATDRAITQIHGLASQEYYQAAIQKVAERVDHPHFFVFSDEIAWAKENLRLPFPATYIDHNGADYDYEDLRLISHCRYHILANSTFSWWGAWLATFPEKFVIAPRHWFADLNSVPPSIYPPEWMVL